MLLLLLLNFGITMATETGETTREVQVLSCWTCQNTENCIRMYNTSIIRTRRCSAGEFFCRVRKVTDEQGIKLLDRACAASCRPGCKKAIKLQTCEECCTEPLCNVGNEAGFIRNDKMVLIICLICVIFFFTQQAHDTVMTSQSH